MRQRQERLDPAVVGVERHRADAVGPAGEPHALENRPYGVGAHELRAVQQSQAFLALEADRFPAEFGPDFRGRPDGALAEHFAEPDERQTQVRQRGEVAGGAEGTLLVDDRKDVVVEHVHQALHGDELHAGVAVGEVLDLEEKHQLDDLRTDGFSGAAGVRHHEVVLELRKVFLRNGDVVQGPEAGGDAVHRLVGLFHLVVQVFTALDDGGRRFV